MITAENISFCVEDTGSKILSNISLTINKGERIGIIGESGSGKTTLGLHLAGVHKKALLGKASGKLLLNDKECIDKDYPGFAGVVLQNPETQIFCDTPEEEILLSLENHSLSDAEKKQSLNEFLEYFGLSDVRSKNISKLSIGMKQRISIACMLVVKPDLLLLDEPTNYLDNSTADNLFDYLKNIEGLTTIVIEHDIDRLIKWANRIIELKDGKIIGDYGKLKFDKLENSNESIRKNRVNKSDYELLKINNVGFSYNGNGKVFEGINLSFKKGEVVAVTGSNGSGKTTLLKLIKGLIKPDEGSVNLNGGNGTKLMEQVAFSFQNPDEQVFAATVKEECEYWLKNKMLDTNCKKLVISNQLLEKFGLGDKVDMLPFVLSYGEKRRLALASVLVVDPDIICLDEPTVALDGKNLSILVNYLHDLAAQNKTIIFSTHDRKFADAIATRIIDLDGMS